VVEEIDMKEQKKRILELTKEIQALIWELHRSVPLELGSKAVDDTNDLTYWLAMFERALENAYEADPAPNRGYMK
jgi:hypothetical protein